MNIQINLSNGVPIYEQVILQIKFAIAAGTIRPGETIPSTRELARELTISPNTVIRAYHDLQLQEIVESNRGLGMTVSENAPEICQNERINLFKKRFVDFLDDALQSNLNTRCIVEFITDELRNHPGFSKIENNPEKNHQKTE